VLQQVADRLQSERAQPSAYVRPDASKRVERRVEPLRVWTQTRRRPRRRGVRGGELLQ